MPGKKFYVGAKQLAELEVEAANRNIEVDELIKRKLQQLSAPSTNADTIDDLQQALVTLANRVQNLELILKRYCVLTEAELLDLGYLRGAITVQAQQNSKAVKAAKQTEQQRQELSRQVKKEIEKYLPIALEVVWQSAYIVRYDYIVLPNNITWMTKKITISLENSVYEYLTNKTDNRSGYINDLIAHQQQIEENKLLEQAYIDQENDPEFHYEKQLWECTVGDGLEDA